MDSFRLIQFRRSDPQNNYNYGMVYMVINAVVQRTSDPAKPFNSITSMRQKSMYIAHSLAVCISS